jgi:TolA-binding protein
VKENPAAFAQLGDRFDAHWTPTILIVDPSGTERHRIEGFIPADDFLSQLSLGVAKAAFARKDYAAAEQLYRDVVDQFPATDAAPEAQYWTGVSSYRATNDAGALKATADAFSQRYHDSTWAKKASVWR